MSSERNVSQGTCITKNWLNLYESAFFNLLTEVF